MSLILVPDGVTRIAAPIEQSLKAECRRGIYLPNATQVRIRNEGPLVVMYFDNARLALRTAQCWDLAWQLYRAGDECTLEKYDGKRWMGEDGVNFVVLYVNGSEIHLDADAARKVAASLWRRSDAVDDFQLQNKVRIVS